MKFTVRRVFEHQEVVAIGELDEPVASAAAGDVYRGTAFAPSH